MGLSQLNLRARWYTPATGRFTQEDPAQDGTNWYAYCANDPVNYADPTGLKYRPIRELAAEWGYEVQWNSLAQKAYISISIGNTLGGVEFYASFGGDGGGSFIQDGVLYVDDNYFNSQMNDYISSALMMSPENDSVTDEGWMIVAAAAGGTILVKAGALVAGATVATQSIATQIVNAPRVGSALQSDLYHRACSYLSAEQLMKGQTFILDAGTEKERILLQVAGEINGKSGIFEYILNSAGEVVHQFFKAGAVINGIPN